MKRWKKGGVFIDCVTDGNIYVDTLTNAVIGCSNTITDVIIPERIGEHEIIAIAPYAFADCRKLKSVVLSDTIYKIGNRAFDSAIHLERVTLPNHIIEMGEGVFYNCKSLEKIEMPPIMRMGDKEPILPRWTFSCCHALETVILPDNLRQIGYGTFALCTGLKTINIPPNVHTIEDWAFAHCNKLEKICLPENIQTVGENAFIGYEEVKV